MLSIAFLTRKIYNIPSVRSRVQNILRHTNYTVLCECVVHPAMPLNLYSRVLESRTSNTRLRASSPDELCSYFVVRTLAEHLCHCVVLCLSHIYNTLYPVIINTYVLFNYIFAFAIFESRQ